MNMDELRTPPSAPAAESALVAALMLDPEAWDSVSSRNLSPADFYTRPARTCFKVISRLADSSAPFDVVSVAEALTPAELEDVGEKSGFFALATAVGSPANARHYAKLVKDASRRRALIAAASAAIERAYAAVNEDDDKDNLSALIGAVDGITQGRGGGGFQSARQLLGRVIEGMERRVAGQPRPCVSTGLTDLDEILGGGFGPGELVILGARPSQGKTALALGIAQHVARHTGPVASFSLEMPGDSFWERIISAESRVALHKVRTDTKAIENYNEWPRLSAVIQDMTQLPLFVDDTPDISVSMIAARARRLKREQGRLSLVILDYLQLLSPEGKAESRNIEVAQMSRRLKIMSMELGCPVLVLSQLNRQLENRPNKRPIMADLRDSGGIEQDADTCLFLYRDEVYNKESKDKGVAEIIVAKQRNGPIGTIRAAWLAHIVRFADLAPEWGS